MSGYIEDYMYVENWMKIYVNINASSKHCI